MSRMWRARYENLSLKLVYPKAMLEFLFHYILWAVYVMTELIIIDLSTIIGLQEMESLPEYGFIQPICKKIAFNMNIIRVKP